MTEYQFTKIIKDLVVAITIAEEYDRYEVLSDVSKMTDEDLLTEIEDALREYTRIYGLDVIYQSFIDFTGSIKVGITTIDSLDSILFTIVTNKISNAKVAIRNSKVLSDIKVYNRLKKLDTFLGESKKDFFRNCVELVMVVSMSSNHADWRRVSYRRNKS